MERRSLVYTIFALLSFTTQNNLVSGAHEYGMAVDFGTQNIMIYLTNFSSGEIIPIPNRHIDPDSAVDYTNYNIPAIVCFARKNQESNEIVKIFGTMAQQMQLKNDSNYTNSTDYANCIQSPKKLLLEGISKYNESFPLSKNVTIKAQNKSIYFADKSTGKSESQELMPLITFKNLNFSIYLDDLLTDILLYLKQKAAHYKKISLSQIVNATIGVPVNLKNTPRIVLKRAGMNANFSSVILFDEPVAASLAYSQDNVDLDDKNIMIFDFGAGTLDTTVMQFHKDRSPDIYGIHGTNIGGQKLTQNLKKNITDTLEARNLTEITLKNDLELWHKAEETKIKLTTLEEKSVDLSYLCEKGGKFLYNVSQQLFNEINQKEFEKITKYLEEVWDKITMIGKNDIDKVLLVGGSSKIPKVKEILKDFYENESLNFQEKYAIEAVAKGLASLTSKTSVTEKSLVPSPYLSKNLGFETEGHELSILFPINTKLENKIKKSTTCYPEQDFQKEIDLMIFEARGTSTITPDATYLGKVHIDIIKPMKSIEIYYTVTFEYDESKILHVTITDNYQNQYPDGKFYPSPFKY